MRNVLAIIVNIAAAKAGCAAVVIAAAAFALD